MTMGFLADVYERIKENEKYIGKWYIISTSNQGSSAGRIMSMTDEKIILNPRQGARPNEKGRLVRAIIPGEEEIMRHSVITIETTTQETIKANCNLINLKQEKEISN